MSYINNPSVGGGGGNSDSIYSVPFTYATSSPLVLQAVTAGQILNRAVVVLTTPFNDPSASVELGTTGSPSAILAPGDVDVSSSDQYETEVLEDFPISDILIFTINPGASTQGAGMLFYRIK